MKSHRPKGIKPKKPGPGQESVWDYPRPPALEQINEGIRVIWEGHEIVRSHAAYRVLETSHPPVYYIPPEDIDMQYLTAGSGASFCEYKGRAAYYNLKDNRTGVPNAAWYYPTPSKAFAAIAGYVAFYPSKVDQAWVGDDLVTAQEGDFYGGWITPKVVGPFKGSAATWGW